MLPLARQGRLKVLGAMTPQRVPVLPEVATFTESGYPLVSTSWFALFAPAGTPRSVIDKIAADVGRVLSTKEFDDRFVTGVGLEMLNQGPDQLAATVVADRAKYQAYVKSVGVKLD
jgi:tripartite-type tricarboxylate transporter receptor subunit TctC